MGVFVNGFTIFFSNLPTFNTFFCFANLLGNGNGCCMEHLQGLRVWFRGGDLHIKRITTHD
jgi:hypothetical protein